MTTVPPRPIVIIGSINMDLVCRTPRIPKPGETIIGTELLTIPGGKGANQAVAAAKLGATVHMIGRIGSDDFGQRLLTGLNQHNVNTRYVTITEGTATGCALILVDRKGENTITVAPGANHKLTPQDIDAAEPLIRTAAAVVMQLEIPLETVRHAIATCQRLNIFTILDPAPVPPRGLSRAYYGVDILTPNQIEAELLLGHRPAHLRQVKRLIDPKQVGSDLLARGPRNVVLKLSSRGALIVDRNGDIEQIDPLKVNVVDTTAAGDAFTAALAVAHSEGRPLPQAVRFANAAGAACCQNFGAQPSLPDRTTVDQLLRFPEQNA